MLRYNKIPSKRLQKPTKMRENNKGRGRGRGNRSRLSPTFRNNHGCKNLGVIRYFICWKCKRMFTKTNLDRFTQKCNCGEIIYRFSTGPSLMNGYKCDVCGEKWNSREIRKSIRCSNCNKGHGVLCTDIGKTALGIQEDVIDLVMYFKKRITDLRDEFISVLEKEKEKEKY